jgi:hypothetical protein
MATGVHTVRTTRIEMYPDEIAEMATLRLGAPVACTPAN